MSSAPGEQQWVTFEVMLDSCMVDAVANFFHEHQASGVVLEERDPERSVVTAYLSQDKRDVVSGEITAYLYHLREVFPAATEPELKTTPLKTENWATAWQADFRPLAIGRKLLVTPPWIKPEPHGRITIVIEPAEAFGTGTHETTQGCLELLEEAIEEFTDAGQDLTVLDVGCGSGILAIAAAKLGAREVRAVDTDPVAVEAARKNVILNGVAEKIRLDCLSAEDVKEPADIVAANLDPKTLKTNKATLVNLFACYLVISGVPIEEWENIKKEFLAEGIFLKKEVVRTEWGSGLFGKRSGGTFCTNKPAPLGSYRFSNK